jgi:hypothetical protein
MVIPSEKLAESLEVLKQLQDKGVAVKSSDISRVHRQRLVKYGFLKEVTKGWYIISSADEQPGSTASWYTSYWQFCAAYLNDRYGDSYFISPDQSLLIHTGNRTVPHQLIVRTTEKTNHKTALPHDTSLWHWESPVPKAAEFVTVDGIRMMTLASSIIYCSAAVFTSNPTDARAALTMIKDSSEITRPLLEGGHSAIAGRLAGAFRNIGRSNIADDILKTMQAADYDVREADPFETRTPALLLSSEERSPYANRIRLMWDSMRSVVIKHFPAPPGIPKDHDKYMQKVEDMYVTDAYHSLSIERYAVTPALIERVRSGSWDVINNESDRQQKDAMAARGYWQAAQKVRQSIRQILNGKNSGDVANADHGDWYRELFAPSVAANIINASALAGYRNSQVYIGVSKHIPMSSPAVRDAMPVLFELLAHESEPGVRAVLGHFIFVYIHPYVDGNGRMGRFLMNAMLASGGYPWTVIPVEERTTYMSALEQASADRNIEEFAKFLSWLVQQGLKGKPVATIK